MSGMSNIGKIILVAVVVALVIVGLIIYGNSGSAPATTLLNQTSTSPLVTAQSPTQTQPGQTTTPPPAQTSAPSQTTPTSKSPTPPTITVVTPVAGDVWIIGQKNPISWSKAGNITGDIYLIDAATKKFVGTINPQIGPMQTSYTWNTLSYSLSRTDPSQVDIVPGTYIIQIAFDGNNLPIISSPAFTIEN